MEHCRVQIGCLLVVIYISFIYFRECKRYHKSRNNSIFDEMLILSIVCIVFDGITAVTVNNLETVNLIWNRVLHLIFLVGIDTVIYMMFGYMLRSTGVLLENRKERVLLHVPYIVNIIVVVTNIGTLEFRKGVYSNYSMGVSAYTCFAMVGIYVFDRKRTRFGIIFAGVAGIMVFISVDELLPAAREYGEHHLSIYGLIGGMMVMAASLLLFM